MIFFVTTVFAAFLFQCCSQAFAYPPPTTDNPPHDLNVAARSTTPPLLFNTSTSTLQTSGIHCYPPGIIKSSFASCLPILNYIRTFPLYRLRQLFIMGMLPREPFTPPVILIMEGEDCAVSITSEVPWVQGMFSWEQVRSAAMAVSAACENNPGYGGWTRVGQPNGWRVRVVGFMRGVGGVNGTVVGEGVDGMVSTVLVADS